MKKFAAGAAYALATLLFAGWVGLEMQKRERENVRKEMAQAYRLGFTIAKRGGNKSQLTLFDVPLEDVHAS